MNQAKKKSNDDSYLSYVILYDEPAHQIPSYSVFNDLDEANVALKKRKPKAIKSKEKKVVATQDGEHSFADLLESSREAFTPYYMLSSASAHMGYAIAVVTFNEKIKSQFMTPGRLVRSIGKKRLYGLNQKDLESFFSAQKDITNYLRAFSVLPASILMSIVSKYDAHLSEIIKYSILRNSNKLKMSNAQLSLREVFAFDNYDSLLEHVVEQQAADILWESHQIQVSEIEKMFSVSIRNDFPYWSEFIEIFERRNLVAHGEKIANSVYRKNCAEAGCEDDNEHYLPINGDLNISPLYLRKATDNLLLFISLLIWRLWIKQYPRKIAAAYEKFSDHTFDLILMKRYTLASRILEFLVNWKNEDLPEKFRRIMTINLANCYKFLDDRPKAIAVIDKYQWDASGKNFQICEAAIRDDLDQVCKLLPSFKHDQSIIKDSFRTWPVFHWMREERRFAEVFEDTFEEKLVLEVSRKSE